MGVLDFFGREAGQRRRAALNELGQDIAYYVPPELRSRLGLLADMTPVAGMERASQASERLFGPDRTVMQRAGDVGDVLSETAGIVAPAAVAGRVGMPAAQAIQEGLLGVAASPQAVAARNFVADEAGAVGRNGFDVTRKDASNVFGEGTERVRYTDPASGGTMEVVVRPDGSASVLELEVPDASRGKGIGQSLQDRVMQDFPKMSGQVSSKAAAKTAYRLGRRPYGQPDATLEDVFAVIDDMSSVNLVSPQMQPSPAQEVAGLLSSGRVDEVTDEMLDKFTPKDEMELFDLYQRGATGMDLPMDEASRMARAGEIDAYHGTDRTFSAFDPTKFGEKDPGWYGRGVTTDTDPEVAAGYANYDEAEIGQQIIPVRIGGGRYMAWPEGQLPFGSLRDSTAGTKDMQSLGYVGSKMTNDRDLYGDVADIQTEYVTFDPSNVRSRFARFDPRLAHLRNLSAGAGGLGLLGMSYPQEEQY